MCDFACVLVSVLNLHHMVRNKSKMGALHAVSSESQQLCKFFLQ
jgi:hypothetical protein